MDSYWLLAFIFIVVSIIKGGEACSDALYCMHHIDGVRTDIQNANLPAICSKTMRLIMCVEASMKDCQVRGVEIPQDNMVMLSSSILQAKTIYKGYCQDITPDPNAERDVAEKEEYRPVPVDASCSQISLCLLDVSAYTDAVSNYRSHDACRLITPTVQCLQSAIQDCDRSGQMSSDMLVGFKESLMDSRAKLRQFCVDENMQAVYERKTDPINEDEDDGSGNVLKATNKTILLGLLSSMFVLSWVLG